LGDTPNSPDRREISCTSYNLSLPDLIGQSSLLDHPVKPYDDIGNTSFLSYLSLEGRG